MNNITHVYSALYRSQPIVVSWQENQDNAKATYVAGQQRVCISMIIVYKNQWAVSRSQTPGTKLVFAYYTIQDLRIQNTRQFNKI